MNGFASALHLIGADVAAPLRAAVVRVAAERGYEPVLVDLDPWAGGSDVLLGLEHVAGVRWHDLDGADGEFDADGLLHRLPAGPLGERVLAHDRWAARPVDPDVVRAAMHALRLSAGLLVVDGAVPADLPELRRPRDRVWVAIGADVRSSAAGIAATQWLSLQGVQHRTVLLHTGAAPEHDEFDRIDELVRVGRSEWRDLDRGVLCGRRNGPLRAFAGRLLDDLVDGQVAA